MFRLIQRFASSRKEFLFRRPHIDFQSSSSIVSDAASDEREPVIRLVPIPKRFAPRDIRDGQERPTKLRMSILVY